MQRLVLVAVLDNTALPTRALVPTARWGATVVQTALNARSAVQVRFLPIRKRLASRVLAARSVGIMQLVALFVVLVRSRAWSTRAANHARRAL